MSSPRIRQLTYRKVSVLKPNPRNPRNHKHRQIEALSRSIENFGFNAPILVDQHGNVIAGHGRLEAAKLLGLEEVPVICLDDLSEIQARAYMIADNRLNELSSWDEPVLVLHFKELSELALEFSIEATGFEIPEIDLAIETLNEPMETDDADNFEVAKGPAVARVGDLFLLGEHRIFCGSALEPKSYEALMRGERAAATFTDPRTM